MKRRNFLTGVAGASAGLLGLKPSAAIARLDNISSANQTQPMPRIVYRDTTSWAVFKIRHDQRKTCDQTIDAIRAWFHREYRRLATLERRYERADELHDFVYLRKVVYRIEYPQRGTDETT